MFKKLMSLVLVAAMLALLPLIGCKKNEYNSHRQSEETTTETHTVVE